MLDLFTFKLICIYFFLYIIQILDGINLKVTLIVRYSLLLFGNHIISRINLGKCHLELLTCFLSKYVIVKQVLCTTLLLQKWNLRCKVRFVSIRWGTVTTCRKITLRFNFPNCIWNFTTTSGSIGWRTTVIKSYTHCMLCLYT